MALYEMYCTQCGDEFLLKQSMHEELPKVCKECGGEVRQRLGKIQLKTCTGEAALERAIKCAESDRERIDKGDQKAISDLVGDKPNPLKQ